MKRSNGRERSRRVSQERGEGLMEERERQR